MSMVGQREVATWIDVATWPSCPGGRDLEVMSRPGLVQCTVLCTVQVTVWTLFIDTVHEHCS